VQSQSSNMNAWVEEAMEAAGDARRQVKSTKVSLDNSHHSLEDRLGKLEQNLTTMSSQMSRIHEDVAAQLAAARAEQERRLEDASDGRIERMSRQCDSLSARLEEVTENLREQLQSRTSRNETRLSELQQQVAGNGASLREQGTKVLLLEESLADIRRAAEAREASLRAKADQRMDGIEDDVDSVRRLLEEVAESREPIRRSIDNASSRLADMEGKLVSLEVALDERDSEAQRNVVAWQTRCDSLIGDIATARKEMAVGLEETESRGAHRLEGVMAKERAHVADTVANLQILLDNVHTKYDHEVAELRSLVAVRRAEAEDKVKSCDEAGHRRCRALDEALRTLVHAEAATLRAANDRVAAEVHSVSEALNKSDEATATVVQELKDKLSDTRHVLRKEADEGTKSAVEALKKQLQSAAEEMNSATQSWTVECIQKVETQIARANERSMELSESLANMGKDMNVRTERLRGEVTRELGTVRSELTSAMKECDKSLGIELTGQINEGLMSLRRSVAKQEQAVEEKFAAVDGFITDASNDSAALVSGLRAETESSFESTRRQLSEIRASGDKTAKELDRKTATLQSALEAHRNETERHSRASEAKHTSHANGLEELRRTAEEAERKTDEVVRDLAEKLRDERQAEIEQVKGSLTTAIKGTTARLERFEEKVEAQNEKRDAAAEDALMRTVATLREEYTTGTREAVQAVKQQVMADVETLSHRLEEHQANSSQVSGERHKITEERQNESEMQLEKLREQQQIMREKFHAMISTEVERIDREVGSLSKSHKDTAARFQSHARDTTDRLSSAEEAVRNLQHAVGDVPDETGAVTRLHVPTELRSLRTSLDRTTEEHEQRLGRLREAVDGVVQHVRSSCEQFTSTCLDGEPMPEEWRQEAPLVQAWRMVQRLHTDMRGAMQDLGGEVEECTSGIAASITSLKKMMESMVDDSRRDCALKLEGQQMQWESAVHVVGQQVRSLDSKVAQEFEAVKSAAEGARKSEEKRFGAVNGRLQHLEEGNKSLQEGLRHVEQSMGTNIQSLQHIDQRTQQELEAAIGNLQRQLERSGAHFETVLAEESRKWASDANAIDSRVEVLERELEPQTMVRRFHDEAKYLAISAAKSEIEQAAVEQKATFQRVLRELHPLFVHAGVNPPGTLFNATRFASAMGDDNGVSPRRGPAVEVEPRSGASRHRQRSASSHRRA